MRPSSAKAKGRRLQDYIRDRILATFPELEPDDVRGAIMGESGVDVKLSPAARRLFPWAVECKNQQRLNIWAALAQTEGNAGDTTKPLLVFSRNRTSTYVALDLDDFLELVGRLSTARTKYDEMYRAGL